MILPDHLRSAMRLRQKLAQALAWLGAAELALIGGGAVLISFALDRLLELPWLLRAGFLAAAALLYARGFRRARARLSRQVPAGDLLAAVERSDPDLEGQLLNAVELRRDLDAAGREAPESLRAGLLRRAAVEAHDALRRTAFDRALDLRPVRRRLAAGAAALGLVVAAAWTFPQDFQLWFARNVLLSTRGWPRATHFAFDREEGTWHHPRKEPLTIEAWVLGEVPRAVTIHIVAGSEATASRLLPGESRLGTWKIRSVEENGAPAPGSEVEARRLSYTLPAALESFDFHLEGGDNRSRPIRVEVHDPPRIVHARVTLKHPPHTGLGERSTDDPAGEIAAVIGTQVEVAIEADQEVSSAWSRFGESAPAPIGEIAGYTCRHSFELKATGFLRIGLAGGPHEFKAQPAQFAFAALPDQPPRVELAIGNRNRLVTPQGKIAYRVEASDDFGLRAIELRLMRSAPGAEEAGGSEPPVESRDLAPWSAERSEKGAAVAIDRDLDLGPLGLEPGMRIGLQAAATDNDEPAGYKTSLSNRELFQVVDAEALREEMDRLRVEAQARLEELAYLERSLAKRIEASPPPGEPGAPPRAGQAEPSASGSQAPAVQPRPAGSREESAASSSGQASQSQASQSQASQSQASQSQASQSQASQSQASQSQASQSQASQSQASQSQASQSQASQSQASQSQASQSQASQSQASQSQASQSQASQSQASPGQASQDQAGRPAPRQEPPRPGEEPFEDLAQEQERIAREAGSVSERLREMASTLQENQLLDEAERRRFEDEVAEPLQEISRERLPQSARDLEAIPRSRRPGEERAQAGEEAERIAADMKEVAERLAQASQFREVLQRLEMIIQLQGKVIEETKKGIDQNHTGEKGTP